ncbi:hypothetical protein Lal_00048511 [Lupinus albus]|nr:hypothetical protein Lal_00048511 [Lupinus albus]
MRVKGNKENGGTQILFVISHQNKNGFKQPLRVKGNKENGGTQAQPFSHKDIFELSYREPGKRKMASNSCSYDEVFGLKKKTIDWMITKTMIKG